MVNNKLLLFINFVYLKKGDIILKKIIIVFSLIFLTSCKTTGIHIIDNPDGTSVKVYYWDGNSQDNQDNIIKIGKRGKLMTVDHNVSFMTKYNTPLEFNLSNGQTVHFKCDKSAHKKDYKGELEYDWEGNPRMECLEHVVTKSTVPAIKVGAAISFGL